MEDALGKCPPSAVGVSCEEAPEKATAPLPDDAEGEQGAVPNGDNADKSRDAAASPADLQRAERLNMLPFPPTISKCRVKRIAFTGGPCSGKTVALSMVAERLRSTGLQVFVCPEATPLMEAAGVSFEHRKGTEQEPSQEAHRRVWLKNTMEMQMTTESALIRIAEASERTCVILFDRGVQDLGIAVDDRCYNAAVQSLGETAASLNARYDAVFHLRTTAKGAVGHFKAGMLPQLAIELDARHQNRWQRHPQFTVIENPATGGMAEKAQQAMSGVCHHVGVRSPTCLCKQMFLCSSSLAEDMSQDWLQEFVDEFRVEITFLEGSKAETNTFLRHRLRRNTEQTFSEADSYTKCSCKWKEDQAGGSRQQTTEEFLITQKEYHNLRSQRADPHCETLVIHRTCFCYKTQWFQVDHYMQSDTMLIEVESPAVDTTVTFPSWVRPHISRRISETPDEVKYQPFNLAFTEPEVATATAIPIAIADS